MIETYETIPQEVQVVQWDGKNTAEVFEFSVLIEHSHLRDMVFGDWVVEDESGHLEIMSDETFHSTYRKKGKIE